MRSGRLGSVVQMASRDPWLDDAKTILVVLVVVGHTLVLVPDSDLRRQLYDFIYSFHMPAFILIAGYLSRGFSWTRRRLLSLVTTLLVPFVVFSLLYRFFRVDVIGELDPATLDPVWLDPMWIMWFLAAMIAWRLLTPILKLHWLMVPVTIGISLVSGLVDLQYFDLNRVFGFLPFFTLGLHLDRGLLDGLRRGWTALPAAVALVLMGVWVVPEAIVDGGTEWLLWRTSYEEIGVSDADGFHTRAILLLVGLLGSLAALCVAPRRTHFITEMGATTMVVYLFHGFGVRWAYQEDLARFLPSEPILAVAVATIVAVGWALLLGWEPVARRLDWLVDPIGHLQERRRRSRETGSDRQAVPHGPGPED